MSEDQIESKENTKISNIFNELYYLNKSAIKNRNLSVDIIEKLLAPETKHESETSDLPKSPATLDAIISKLQNILDLTDTSNHFLISLNKGL